MKHDMAPVQRLVVGMVGLAIATTTLAACSSSTNKSSGGNTSDAALGALNKASGTPVKIGFVNDGVSAAIDTSDEAKAADAVVKYANDYLGGIGGRPIELTQCVTNADPAQAQSCGNELVAAKVLAVASGSLGQTGPVIKAINAAGIPLVDILNQDPAFLKSPIDFSLSNPLNAFGGAAIFAKKHGITHSAMIVIDVPAAVEPAKQLGPLLFGNAGGTVDVVGVPPGTADMTPQIQAEAAKKPGLYHIIGNPSFCASALKAIKTLGLTAKVTGIDRCLDKASAASIPGGFKGMTVFTPASLDPAADDTKLYDAILRKYSPGVTSNANYSTGYQAMMGLIRALNQAPVTDFTSAGFVAAIKAAKAVPIPLGGGGTFTCDGKQIFVSPAICSSGGITADATADGGVENFSAISDPTIYNPPPAKK